MNDHLKKTLKLNSTTTPWFKMFLYGISIVLPMIIGYLYNNFATSMLGSLFALVLALIDHMGPLKSRIVHLIWTTLFLLVSLILGIVCIPYFYLQIIVLTISAFLLGKFKDRGVELERLFLFCILYFTTMSDSPNLLAQFKLPIIYSIIGFICYSLTLFATHFFRKEQLPVIKSKRETFKNSLNDKSNTYFAIVYSLTNTLSFALFKYFNFERTYWIIGTILIVMLPDFYQGLYKSLQRIIGTIFGVIIAAIILNFHHDQQFLMMGIFLFAFLIPYGMAKNYWLGNLFVAALVIFFLDANKNFNVIHASQMRALDISFGGIIAVISSYVFLKKYFHNLKSKQI